MMKIIVENYQNCYVAEKRINSKLSKIVKAQIEDSNKFFE